MGTTCPAIGCCGPTRGPILATSRPSCGAKPPHGNGGTAEGCNTLPAGAREPLGRPAPFLHWVGLPCRLGGGGRTIRNPGTHTGDWPCCCCWVHRTSDCAWTTTGAIFDGACTADCTDALLTGTSIVGGRRGSSGRCELAATVTGLSWAVTVLGCMFVVTLVIRVTGLRRGAEVLGDKFVETTFLEMIAEGYAETGTGLPSATCPP